MQLTSQRTANARADEANPLKLDVLLVHEDLPAGWRAKQVLDQVGFNLEPKTEIHLNLWNFELLRDPVLRRRAVIDAVRADIVLLAALGRAALPAPVGAWLQQWLERRDASPCALVVSLDTSVQDSTGENPVLNHVRALAGRSGVELFPHFGATPRVAWNWTIDGIQRQVVTPTALMGPILDLHRRRPLDWASTSSCGSMGNSYE